MLVTLVSPAETAELTNSHGFLKPCIKWSPDFPRVRAILGVVLPVQQYKESLFIAPSPQPRLDFNDFFPRKEVLFAVALILLLSRGVSPKNNFCGCKYAFILSLTRRILKPEYCRNYYADSNDILHCDKDHQILFLCGPNTRIPNSRWRMAAILKSE